MTDPTFHGDRPIQTEAEDRFGFAALAARIAEALTTQAADKGFVLGLEGKWGSGKSSLLALTLKHLRNMDMQKVAAVEFRPWLIGDHDQLLASLFEDLAKAIAGLHHASGDATGTTRIAAKDVAEQVKSFARHLAPLGKLTGAVGLLVPGAELLGSIIEKISEAASEQAEGPTLVAQKEKINEGLRELDCRIVVAIDDVDRLEPREVAELMRLVRSVADFPNVSYLLCYDARALECAIQTGTGVKNGAAYLEKIIQTEVAVPRPESFALRRWFSSELQAFAECSPGRIPDLQHVIDETGGRVLENPRAVVRVLDSLRVYWPSLKDRVDLADLVWLRMIAVSAPNFYRWLEEYLISFVALASGRAHISDQQKTASEAQMDVALKMDSLHWEKHRYEIERYLPGIQHRAFDTGQGHRIFSRIERLSHLNDIREKRLASPSHSRIYFTLIDPPDCINDIDIANLIECAYESINSVSLLFINMAEKRGDAGGSKAERLLDQIRYVESEIISSWPIETILFGLANAADELGKDKGDHDWGYPRTWYLVRAFFMAVNRAIGSERFESNIVSIFENSHSLGFLTYLLRDETFGHGMHGGRPKPNDRLVSREGYDRISSIMILRYSRGGLNAVVAEAHATNMLYAWSQAGARDDVIARVAAQSDDDDWLLEFVQMLYGPNSSLSLDAMSNFFSSPASVVRRIFALASDASTNLKAQQIIRSLKSNCHINDDDDFSSVIEEWEVGERKDAAPIEQP